MEDKYGECVSSVTIDDCYDDADKCDCDGEGCEDKDEEHCTVIQTQAYSHVCASTENTCSVTSYDGTRCDKLCAKAGMECQWVEKNIGDTCEPDLYSPALSCKDSTGDSSELCVCGLKALDPKNKLPDNATYKDGQKAESSNLPPENNDQASVVKND